MWIVYLIMMLDAIDGMLMAAAVTSGILIFGILFTYLMDIEENIPREALAKWRKLSIITFVISLPLTCLVPNSKQAITILAVGSTIEYVQNNESIKQLPDKTVDCLNKFIDDYLKEDNNN